MKQTKSDKIIDLHIESKQSSSKSNYLAAALYESAKGTKHFYETLDFLSDAFPDLYGEEFIEFDIQVQLKAVEEGICTDKDTFEKVDIIYEQRKQRLIDLGYRIAEKKKRFGG
jgi:hypothetical protein